MRASIADPFYAYTVSHEGYTPFLYTDNLNLVSTGIGLLLDGGMSNKDPRFDKSAPLDISDHAITGGTRNPLTMRWYHKGPGWTPYNPVIADQATPDEVKAAWIQVKQDPKNGKTGGFAYQNDTNITQSAEDMRAIYDEIISSFEAELKRYFPNWDTWPADAQFATMSMAYAMGPNFPAKFTKFASAANALDFDTAAQESYFQGGNAWNTPNASITNRTGRNGDNFVMFSNAAEVLRSGGDPNVLVFQVGKPPTFPLASPRKTATGRIASAGLPWLPILIVGGAIFGGTLLLSPHKKA